MPWSPAASIDLPLPGLATLLLACCLTGSLAIVSLARMDEASEDGRIWRAGLAGAALGLSAWVGHALALLALGGVEGAAYDFRIVGASLVIALVVAVTAVYVTGAALTAGAVVKAAIGGALFGSAAALAAFIGVTALRAPGRASLDMAAFSLATLVVVVGAAGAFALAARLKTIHGYALAAAALGMALFAFHALSTFDAVVRPNARLLTFPNAIDGMQLAFVAAAVSVVSLIAAFVGVMADGRFGAGGSQQNARDRAFADLTNEGLVICEDQRIVDVNLAAARLIGLDPAVLRGRALRDFLAAPDPDRLLSASFAKPQEALLKATGRETVPVEIASRDMALEGRLRRVYTLRDLSEQRRNEHRIRHLAYHDPLTGLANRAAFNEALAAALKRGGEVALFCVDLDKFKEVNDVFGHAAGDDLLRTASRRIVSAAPDAMTFRLGGDEFVLIGTGPDAGDADKLAARLTERLNTETVIAGKTIRCGASVGYAVYPHHGSTTDALFANADSALYRAKAEGRGLARGFEPEMDLALRERRALQQDLATAISRDEMFLHWMPQANTRTGEIVGFEALLRWKHPTRGVVSPAQFIPVAEETAAIVPIGEWVLRRACQDAVGWIKPGKVAVNLSPVQFQHGDIVELVHGILVETGLPAKRLELEITEGVLLDNLSSALHTLRRLKALGVQIAMDDFGTGYSSLSYLQSFPFDRIKIDASFIRQLSTSPQAKAIVRAVVALGESLDMPITAEGVETAEQRAFLAELNCEEIQGYLIGRPSPVVSFDGFMTRNRAFATR
ncbi:putative bifunctional diguanylate cyclase/phosphodiesterase [Methylopila sp. Yamaguchi]|uniref:putative bifunctional diguanylate cyclase/phosphodiesterase n=1 Tax=Methylopila sp. Yamaguchi TaxID=1437817 RepID=UPI000CB5B3F4|nr:GGDEF and EAL domain-containing protein [Methylopila sp. Yamaguchi]GBD49774.1 PAS/PAC sensor-containing diguanylate cyclase/phosphodiesterase [Methylopila sp. Yamaguchi]